MISNYEITLQSAMKRFCSYDMESISRKHGITDRGEYFETRFLGMETKINKNTGAVTVNGQPADFCEGLSIFDWLCDGKPDAKAAESFCPVSSLPGVLVRGQGLLMEAPELAREIDLQPEKFRNICKNLGGKILNIGDFGVRIDVFPDLPMEMKFYHSDEEFPPTLTFLWDANILDFVRYETVYYICGALKKHLLHKMQHKKPSPWGEGGSPNGLTDVGIMFSEG